MIIVTFVDFGQTLLIFSAVPQVLAAMVPPSRKRPAPEPEKNYDAMTVAELRAECTRRGLASYGSKAVMLTRLRDAE